MKCCFFFCGSVIIEILFHIVISAVVKSLATVADFRHVDLISISSNQSVSYFVKQLVV